MSFVRAATDRGRGPVVVDAGAEARRAPARQRLCRHREIVTNKFHRACDSGAPGSLRFRGASCTMGRRARNGSNERSKTLRKEGHEEEEQQTASPGIFAPAPPP